MLNDLLLLIYQFFVLPLPPPPALEISTLIALGEHFEINSGAVRTAMCRLKKEGFFTVSKTKEKTYYAITPKAIMTREPFNKKVFVGEDVYLNWSREWWLVSFSFEETQAKRRHQLRSLLKNMDFGQLHRGVWLKPIDPYLWLERELASQGLSEQVEIFSTRIEPLEKAQALVNRLWDLPKIFAEYDSLQDTLRGKVADYSEWDDQECFRQQMKLFIEFAAPLVAQPLLPPQLLPANQPGIAYRQLFNRLNERLLLKSRRYVNSLILSRQQN